MCLFFNLWVMRCIIQSYFLLGVGERGWGFPHCCLSELSLRTWQCNLSLLCEAGLVDIFQWVHLLKKPTFYSICSKKHLCHHRPEQRDRSQHNCRRNEMRLEAPLQLILAPPVFLFIGYVGQIYIPKSRICCLQNPKKPEKHCGYFLLGKEWGTTICLLRFWAYLCNLRLLGLLASSWCGRLLKLDRNYFLIVHSICITKTSKL